MTRLHFLLVVGFAVTFVGCGGDGGPPLAPVKGKVTLYGKPYTKGIVTFSPEGGGPSATSRTDENGDYELWSAGKKGAAIGKHKVSVTTILEQPTTTAPADMKSDDPNYAAQASGALLLIKLQRPSRNRSPKNTTRTPNSSSKSTRARMRSSSNSSKLSWDSNLSATCKSVVGQQPWHSNKPAPQGAFSFWSPPRDRWEREAHPRSPTTRGHRKEFFPRSPPIQRKVDGGSLNAIRKQYERARFRR